MNELIPIEVANRERAFREYFWIIPPLNVEKIARLFGIPSDLLGGNDTNYSSSHVALEQFKRQIGIR